MRRGTFRRRQRSREKLPQFFSYLFHFQASHYQLAQALSKFSVAWTALFGVVVALNYQTNGDGRLIG